MLASLSPGAVAVWGLILFKRGGRWGGGAWVARVLLPILGGKMAKGFGGFCCRAVTEINVYSLCGMLCGCISMTRVMGCILWVGVGSIIVCSLFLFERG